MSIYTPSTPIIRGIRIGVLSNFRLSHHAGQPLSASSRAELGKHSLHWHACIGRSCEEESNHPSSPPPAGRNPLGGMQEGKRQGKDRVGAALDAINCSDTNKANLLTLQARGG